MGSAPMLPAGSVVTNVIQWNPSITDTVGNQNFVRYTKVSQTQGVPVYFRYRRGMRNAQSGCVLRAFFFSINNLCFRAMDTTVANISAVTRSTIASA